MSIIELIVLSFGLAMDAFAVSICKGLSLGKVNRKDMVVAGVWFGGFQALMPVVGFFLGSLLSDVITKFDHWIAFVLLCLIGAGMIKESFEKEELDTAMDVKTMLMLAIATSIDALAVGVTFAFLKVNIIIAVTFIGVITLACSAVGIKLGSIFGNKYKSKAEITGGIVLIFIGLKILLEGLRIF